MAFRYSTELRNAGLDARIQAVGPKPVLKIYAGAQAMGGRDPVGELVSMQLPDGWMGKADDGVVSSNGTWSGKATANGKAKSFRIYGGKTCHIEGSIPDEMKLDNPNIASGQMVTVEDFTIRSGNG